MNSCQNEKKIAIVCDWLIDFGGAELVISDLLELFPEADIYTSVCYMEHPMLQERKVFTSWIQKIPFFNRKHKLAGILRPYAFRNFDLSKYDIIICSCSAESKNVALGKWRKKSDTPIIVYCHTPIRYYWSHAQEYEQMMEFGWMNPFVKQVFRLVKSWMQRVDYQAAQAVDVFLANSKTTAERIQKYYHRDAKVIYPWVQSIPFLNTPRKDYYFGMSRCIPYKKLDLLVETFNQNGKKLILATNTDNLLYHELRRKSRGNIKWIFAPDSNMQNQLYREARAFLFPPEEDFGLVPVEAMMHGTPVIAYGKWGATESVIDGETGIFFSEQTPEALNEALNRFEQSEWDQEKIWERGTDFWKERFQNAIQKEVSTKGN